MYGKNSETFRKADRLAASADAPVRANAVEMGTVRVFGEEALVYAA
jgi:hypothetical protein